MIPTGVRTPVVSMSMRALMGMVQAFVWPGMRSAWSISATSSSQVIRSRQTRRRTASFSHSGAQPEYQRSFGRHSESGFSWTTVSIIEKGAGSVEVSARPALPWTLTTSGNAFRIRSWTWSRREASVTLMPGSVVGM